MNGNYHLADKNTENVTQRLLLHAAVIVIHTAILSGKLSLLTFP